MASPMTTGGQPGYGWSPAPTNQPPMGNAYQSEPGEMGVQVRPMALKVHYTFDRDGKINCLARLPQTLQVQTVPLDDRNWIGIVDIRLCIQAIAQGSPELLAQSELDYAIYAIDFSEPDTPLVGQGMMSWVMDPSSQPGASQMVDDTPKMVTGRVAKNMLGLFGNGARETLEVRLKLSESLRPSRPAVGANTNSSVNMGTTSNTMMNNNNMSQNNMSQNNMSQNNMSQNNMSQNNMNQNNMMNNSMLGNNINNNNSAMSNDGAMAASYNTRAGSNAPASNAPTPTDTTEWNSFMQSNPGLGRSTSISTMYQSPNMMPARPDLSGFPPAVQPMDMAGQGLSFDSGVLPMAHPVSRPASQAAASRPNSRQSIGPARSGSFVNIRPLLPTPLSQPSSHMGNADSLPMAVPMPSVDIPQVPARPPRVRAPRSRATGRPRGRPKKRPATDGNTSAAEELPTDNDPPEANDTNENAATPETNDVNDSIDANDGEDAHKKKRAKTTKADYPVRTSLDTAPDSLRVAASTNGSLRTLRPVMPEPNTMVDGPIASTHLQEFPRAPTPVPQGPGGGLTQVHARKRIAQKSRQESMAEFDSSTAMAEPSYSRSVGGHSPTDSLAPSPDNYTPEQSPADIGSSPPVPRTTSYVPQSSPMPSSPPLPPMRRIQPDSGFMSGGAEGLFDEDDIMTEKVHPPPTPLDTMAPTPSMDFALPQPQSEAANAAPSPSVVQTPNETPNAPSPPDAQPANAAPSPPNDAQPAPTQPALVPAATAASTQPTTRPTKSNKRGKPGNPEQFEFKSMEPGPPELLPTTMLYNPPPPPPKSRAKNQKSTAKPNPPSLERSNSAPHRPLLPAPPNQPRPLNQPSQLSQPRQLPFLLPAEPSNSAERAATHPPAASRPQASSSQQIDVPNDMKELARFLAASADNDQDTVSLVDVGNGADESSTSPGQSQPVLPQQPAAEVARMAQEDAFPLPLPRTTAVPASDPPGLPPFPLPSLPLPETAFSEAPCPPSDMEIPNSRYNKNLMRKAAIKEKLEKAIESGEMPTFCQNCGAIETPTWRKMWTQDHEGEPEEYEFSEKPGQVTAVDILERGEDGKVKKYRLIKKSLSNTDDGKLWKLMLLCNPCGIWLGKSKTHRPSDRWDKDASRLTQPKARRGRSRRAPAKSDNQQPQPTSEAYFTTDPAGPPDHEEGLAPSVYITQMAVPAGPIPDPSTTVSEDSNQSAPGPVLPSEPAQHQPTATAQPSAVDDQSKQADFQAGSNRGPASAAGTASQQGPGSTHSRGSGTAKSPIAVDDAYGPTRRLLFPSPRKEGVLKVLGELAVNVIGTVLGSPKPNKQDKQTGNTDANTDGDNDEQDDMADLFGTPPPKTSEAAIVRPSTPPPRSGDQGSPDYASGPFKTPTRPTPSHRPITRSVSKTIRSGVSGSGASFPKSPMVDGGLLIQRTPSKTPRSAQVGTTTRQQQRRLAAVTPSRSGQLQFPNQQNGGVLSLDNMPLNLESMPFDTPFTSLNKLLSEANDFTTGSPSHGLTELDLASLANLDSNGLAVDFSSSADMDFSSYLEANMTMSSSSPHKGLGKHMQQSHDGSNGNVSFGGEMPFDVNESMWSDFNDAVMKDNGKQ